MGRVNCQILLRDLGTEKTHGKHTHLFARAQASLFARAPGRKDLKRKDGNKQPEQATARMRKLVKGRVSRA